ncbi:hypothetical protein tb265_38290 [Gemmatimonadetes bacterium T265]|nr:hypothetical protein tb265_38290 [Gemmatimonadetes bacterium T265]
MEELRMADQTPGEANVERDGAQLNLREAREVAAERGTVRAPASQGNADRAVTEAPDGPNVATSNTPGDRGARGGAGTATQNEPSPDQHPFTDSETALGGADSVQKTTWGVGHGGEPDGTEEHAPVGLRKGDGDVVARVSTGGGVSPVAVVVGVLALLALLVYAFGIFRR